MLRKILVWFCNFFRNLGNLLQMLEDVPRITNGVQLSIVQGYMSKFYRIYEAWVARNPVLVLCSSVAIVLLLCLDLVRFRPEKVDAMRANYSGTMVSLTDICMKPLGKDCATQSILRYFKIDSGKL